MTQFRRPSDETSTPVPQMLVSILPYAPLVARLVWNQSLITRQRCFRKNLSSRGFAFILELQWEHLRHEKVVYRASSAKAIWDMRTWERSERHSGRVPDWEPGTTMSRLDAQMQTKISEDADHIVLQTVHRTRYK